jgi:electron transfer flavoprotein alpha/beta subunit
MLKHDLPMYDRQMNPIDRKALEEAVRGEGK